MTKIKLVQTCGACPEQYDAFDENDKLVGYLRLRHGHFTVEYPDVNGELIFAANPKGDGEFYDDERVQYLLMAKEAIHKKIHNQQEIGINEPIDELNDTVKRSLQTSSIVKSITPVDNNLKTLKDIAESIVAVDWDYEKDEGIAVEDSHMMVDITALRDSAINDIIKIEQENKKLKEDKKEFAKSCGVESALYNIDIIKNKGKIEYIKWKFNIDDCKLVEIHRYSAKICSNNEKVIEALVAIGINPKDCYFDNGGSLIIPVDVIQKEEE